MCLTAWGFESLQPHQSVSGATASVQGRETVIEVTQTSAEGLKREFRVVVEDAAIEERVDAKLGELAGRISLPGFRPGKAPLSLLRKRYGDAVRGEVLEETVNEGTQRALSDQDLRLAVRPEVEITRFEEGGGLEYTLSIEAFPEIEPIDFSSIAIERLRAQPTEEHVRSHLEWMAKTQTTYETEEDREARSGDAVVVDFVGRRDGVEFEGGNARDFEFILGSGAFIPEFDDRLAGATAGRHLDIDMTFPEDYPAEELAGQSAVFEVDVKEVKRPETPAIDDELAVKMGVETLEELTKAVSDQIRADYDRISRERVKRQLLDALAERCDFEIPRGLIDDEFEEIWGRIGGDLRALGEDEEGPPKSEEEAKKEYRAIAERRVGLGLLLSDVGRRNNIEVRQDEIDRAMAEYARRFPEREHKVLLELRNDSRAMTRFRGPLLEDKVVDFILEMADVSEREVTPDELLDGPEDDEESLS